MEAKSQQREEQLKRRRQTQIAEAGATTSQVQLKGSSFSVESREDSSTSMDSDNEQNKTTPQTKRYRPNNIWTPELTVAWIGQRKQIAML